MSEYSLEEVGRHNLPGDLWIVVNNKVYDVTRFARDHPGGEDVLLEHAGKDCTDEFYSIHGDAANQMLEAYWIGIIGAANPAKTKPPSKVYRHLLVGLCGAIGLYLAISLYSINESAYESASCSSRNHHAYRISIYQDLAQDIALDLFPIVIVFHSVF